MRAGSTTNIDRDGQKPVSRGFMARYALAQIGAFIAFVPLLQVLLPLRAAAIDPVRGTALLSHVALMGAVVASLSNIAFGMLSDRTRATHPGRRPWLLGGLAATLASYVLIWRAMTPGSLFVAIMVFQLAFNALFAPLGAVLADRVPEHQRGLMSALLGLGNPLGSVIGLTAIGAFRMGDTSRYDVVGLLVLFCVLPFAWWLRGDAVTRLESEKTAAMAYPFTRTPVTDIALVWTSRVLVMTTISIIQGYMLTFLHMRGVSQLPLSIRPEAAIAQMTGLATLCNISCGLLCGLMSDRWGRRKLFVAAGGLLLAAGMGCLALAPGWAGLRAAAILYGAGTGLYATIDLALIIQILPSTRRAGQFLGIMNLSNTVAQVAAPLLALQVLGGTASHFRLLFLLAGAASLLGAVCMAGVGRAEMQARREAVLF